ncbi:hypothetical protein BGW41_001684 [Actinomortierella wolfii]|nr:hypothetical protein BGW41_001684 [Actinomortierella wolfii]
MVSTPIIVSALLGLLAFGAVMAVTRVLPSQNAVTTTVPATATTIPTTITTTTTTQHSAKVLPALDNEDNLSPPPLNGKSTSVAAAAHATVIDDTAKKTSILETLVPTPTAVRPSSQQPLKASPVGTTHDEDDGDQTNKEVEEKGNDPKTKTTDKNEDDDTRGSTSDLSKSPSPPPQQQQQQEQQQEEEEKEKENDGDGEENTTKHTEQDTQQPPVTTSDDSEDKEQDPSEQQQQDEQETKDESDSSPQALDEENKEPSGALEEADKIAVTSDDLRKQIKVPDATGEGGKMVDHDESVTMDPKDFLPPGFQPDSAGDNDKIFKAAVLPDGHDITEPLLDLKAKKDSSKDRHMLERQSASLHSRADPEKPLLQKIAADASPSQLLNTITTNPLFKTLARTAINVALHGSDALSEIQKGSIATASGASIAQSDVEKRLAEFIDHETDRIAESAIHAIEALLNTNQIQDMVQEAERAVESIEKQTEIKVVSSNENDDKSQDQGDSVAAVEESGSQALVKEGDTAAKEKENGQAAFKTPSAAGGSSSQPRDWQKKQRQNAVTRISLLNQILKPIILQARADIRDLVVGLCQGTIGPLSQQPQVESNVDDNSVNTEHADVSIQLKDVLDPKTFEIVQKCVAEKLDTLKTQITNLLVARLRETKDLISTIATHLLGSNQVANLVGNSIPLLLNGDLGIVSENTDGKVDDSDRGSGQPLLALNMDTLLNGGLFDSLSKLFMPLLKGTDMKTKDNGSGLQPMVRIAISAMLDQYLEELIDIVENGLLESFE